MWALVPHLPKLKKLEVGRSGPFQALAENASCTPVIPVLARLRGGGGDQKFSAIIHRHLEKTGCSDFNY